MNRSMIFKELKSELMAYDVERDEIHILNDTAKLIYHLSQEGKTLSQIETLLKKAFQVSEEQSLSRDISICLERLREKRLLAGNEVQL
jgi:hypothetical protein